MRSQCFKKKSRPDRQKIELKCRRDRIQVRKSHTTSYFEWLSRSFLGANWPTKLGISSGGRGDFAESECRAADPRYFRLKSRLSDNDIKSIILSG